MLFQCIHIKQKYKTILFINIMNRDCWSHISTFLSLKDLINMRNINKGIHESTNYRYNEEKRKYLHKCVMRELIRKRALKELDSSFTIIMLYNRRFDTNDIKIWMYKYMLGSTIRMVFIKKTI